MNDLLCSQPQGGNHGVLALLLRGSVHRSIFICSDRGRCRWVEQSTDPGGSGRDGNCPVSWFLLRGEREREVRNKQRGWTGDTTLWKEQRLTVTGRLRTFETAPWHATFHGASSPRQHTATALQLTAYTAAYTAFKSSLLRNKTSKTTVNDNTPGY